jgi:outer membrane lipoprotein-sorting protein
MGDRLCLLVFLAGSPLLASDPAAELSRAARFFQDGKAHVAEFTQTYVPAGFSHGHTETGTLTVQAPENIRFEYTSPAGKIFTFDGATARFLSTSDRQMTSRRLTESERATLPLVFLESPAALARSFDLSLAEGPPQAVALKPRSGDASVTWIRLALAASGAPTALSYESSSGDRTDFRFGDFRTEAPLPASQFVLKPPPGTHVEENRF